MTTPKRILAVALAAAALVAPATASAVAPHDMHGEEARALTKSHVKKQDLRSPDARDAAVHPRGPGHAIQPRGHGAAVPPAPAQPAAPPAVTQHADDGVDWTMIGIGAGAAFAAVGLLAALAGRRIRATA
jgi:hypothetical protein